MKLKQTRQIYTLDSLPGRTAIVQEKEWLYFSGTNYLGIVQDPDFKALVGKGIDMFGVHFGGSRLSNMKLAIYEEAESLLAESAQLESALTVTSGTLAGRLLLQLFDENCLKCHAPGAHPAISSGGKYVEFYEQWLDDVFTLAKEHQGKTLVLLSNSVDPLHACKANFDWVYRMPKDIPIVLIIDDSHGFGIIGDNGSGIAPELHLPDNITLLIVSSLGKALGIPGGVILGPKSVVSKIWHLPLFGGASPVSPAYLYAYVYAQNIYKQKRDRLMKNLSLFNSSIEQLTIFNAFPSFPVYYTRKNDLASFLEKFRIMISCFPYPTPNDDLITRIVINGMHTQEDLEVLSEKLHIFCNDHG